MDATLKEVNIRKSIKKFFVDGLPNIKVFFDRELNTAWFPSGPAQWVTVYLQGLRPGHVSNAYMPVYIFTKQDREGELISELRDTVFELLEPGSIPLYNTSVSPWIKIGGLMLTNMSQSGIIYHEDQSKVVVMHNTLKWGAVWS